jgi:serine/threonine protein kinase/formylglycine-generating enzyme required for sulfatase activity
MSEKSQHDHAEAYEADSYLSIDRICDEFESGWQSYVRHAFGVTRPDIVNFVGRQKCPDDTELFRQLLRVELEYRIQLGEAPQPDDYAAMPEPLWGVAQDEIERGVQSGPAASPDRSKPASTRVRGRGSSTTNQHSEANSDEELPESIGRYRVEGLLGRGAFGQVYRAYDDQLQRRVAIKVPRAEVVSRAGVEQYIKEARTAASLKHPNIVTTFDIGQASNGDPYVVSQFISGSDLGELLSGRQFSLDETVALVAQVADALHHAHRNHVVHRDIKPSNILLDDEFVPHITDFGLALADDDYGNPRSQGGTPAYMSPEQVRLEGHLVDGRSDIFSLGVVFYVMLTNTHPFRGESRDDLFERIATTRVVSPRQINEQVPPELERICLKCLAKRAVDRYASAEDLADDLRHFVTTQLRESQRMSQTILPTSATNRPRLAEDAIAGGIVPKGLRSFDGEDVEFFTELIPGPRDRYDCPESVRFWKSRLEQRLSVDPLRIGLIYGPSGCGKSSFVKAGLLPRLAEFVTVAFVEATREGTEAAVLQRIGAHFPEMATYGALPRVLQHLRTGTAMRPGRKLLIVIDRFEQWLHGHAEPLESTLVDALRQCDGDRVQALLIVRDDYWMSLTRFLEAVEIDLVCGRNARAMDDFPQQHASDVLEAFGRAYHCLPETPLAPASEQSRFITRVVAELAESGPLIPLRLAMFVEMTKAMRWTPDALDAAGGIAGITTHYWERLFSRDASDPRYRQHQAAIEQVLFALLPPPGQEIRMTAVDADRLQAAAGYAQASEQFDEVLTILDTETRLISAVDVERAAGGAPSPVKYELTHDYLVPPLREWMQRKQKESVRGRTQMKLDELTAIWSVTRERRHLPGLWNTLMIAWLVRPTSNTPLQLRLFRSAVRYHEKRTFLAVLCAAVGAMLLFGWNYHAATMSRVAALETNDTQEAAIVGASLKRRRFLAEPVLQQKLKQLPVDSNHHLHCQLALAQWRPEVARAVMDRLWSISPDQPSRFIALSNCCGRYHAAWQKDIEDVIEDSESTRQQKFLALCAQSSVLHDRLPEAELAPHAELVAEQLVQWGARSTENVAAWVGMLPAQSESLQQALMQLYRNENHTLGHRLVAAMALVQLDKQAIGEVIAATPLDEIESVLSYVLFPRLGRDAEIRSLLERELSQALARCRDEVKEEAGRAGATAAKIAVALLMCRGDRVVWEAVAHSSALPPDFRTSIVELLGSTSVDQQLLLDTLERNKNSTVLAIVIQGLGSRAMADSARDPADAPPAWMGRVEHWHSHAPTAELHASCTWLLKRMGYDARIPLEPSDISDDLLADAPWFVTRSGLVMVPCKAGEFSMGEHSRDRRADETVVVRQITLPFAIAATEVTVEQFDQFSRDELGGTYQEVLEEKLAGTEEIDLARFAPTGDCPRTNVNWIYAAWYCNWLSKQEGIPEDQWCYRVSRAGLEIEADALQRFGYRLPTEVEWEYACRAGTESPWFFGTQQDLLGRYAWCAETSEDRSHPAGGCLPNPWGLFDMYGNVWEWCHETYEPVPEDDGGSMSAAGEILRKGDFRCMRGGSFNNPRPHLRSAMRGRDLPTRSSATYGIRVARTLPPPGPSHPVSDTAQGPPGGVARPASRPVLKAAWKL